MEISQSLCALIPVSTWEALLRSGGLTLGPLASFNYSVGVTYHIHLSGSLLDSV